MLTFEKDSPALKAMLAIGWRIVDENADGTVNIKFGPQN
jgi:hypothetical protein